MTNIKNIYRSIKNGISNIIRWLPIIWNDYDWDDWYIFNLLYHKFNNMEEFFRGDKVWSTTAKDTADKLKVAKLLCKRIMDKNYINNALTLVEQKYGKSKFYFKESNHTDYKILVWDESEEEKRARRKAYKHSDYMMKQDINYLFNHLKKYIKKENEICISDGGVMGDKYLISYEFKEKDGCWVTTKTKTKIFYENELCNIAKLVDSHDNYLKIIFCQKL